MPSSAKRILTNTFWLTGAEAVNVVLSLVSGIIIVRYLGDSRYGQLAFAQAFVALFSIFTDFGWSALMVNEASRDRSKLASFLNNLITVKLLMGAMTALVIISILAFTDKSLEVKTYVYILTAGTVISAIAGPLSAVFRVFQEMRYEALIRIGGIAASFIITLWVASQQASLMTLVVLGVAVSAVSLIVTTWVVRKKYFKFRIHFDRIFVKEAFRGAFPLGVSAIFVSVYYYLDTVILSFIKTDQEVGWYNASYRFLMMLLTFMGLYFSALFPELSRIIEKEPERAKLLSRVSLRTLATLTLPVAVGTIFISGDILELFFGMNFRAGASALTILIWSVPVIAIASIYGNLLLAKAERKVQLFGVGLGALVNVLLNIMLIPKFSLTGAAGATLFAEVVVLLFFYMKSSKKIFILPFLPVLYKPLLAVSVMAAGLIFLPKAHVLVTVGIGALLYVFSLMVIKGLTAQDIRTAFSILRTR